MPTEVEALRDLACLTERLLQRSVAESDIEKILGGNFMRVFRAVEAGAVRA